LPAHLPDDLVARRQAQLQELRRRQAQSGAPVVIRTPGGVGGFGGAGAGRGPRAAGPVPPSGVVIQRIPHGGPAPPARRPGAPRSRTPAAPSPVRGNDPASLEAARREERARREAAMRQAELQEQARLEAERRQREAAARTREAEGEPRTARAQRTGSPFHLPDGRLKPARELRDLIIAAEILGTPLGLREE